MIRIAIDKDIPYAAECFGQFGELIPFAGRSLHSVELQGADALVVRTVSRVDAKLLQGSAIRFVGTASSGEDHIDRDYLQSRGIAFASAHGCNARPVAEYVLAALAEASVAGRLEWGKTSIAVVGCGAVGRELTRLLLALKWPLAVCDPYLDSSCQAWLTDRGIPIVSFRQALTYPAITLHVALSAEGAHPSAGMIDDEAFAAMPSGVVLINSSRGEVMPLKSAMAAVSSNRLGYLALDVWPDEPNIDGKLLQAADLATAHIAGYSALAKLRASQTLAAALAAHFGVSFDSNVSGNDSQAEAAIAAVPRHDTSPRSQPQAVIREALPLQEISSQFKQQLAAEGDQAVRQAVFDASRKTQLQRREFSQFWVDAAGPGLDSAAGRQLAELGFRL